MKLQPSLTPELKAWALSQPCWFIASAPLHGKHINVSPKGMTESTFSVLSPNQVAYLDRTGSGCETISHLYENGRATIMFMSFGPTPRILRLFCKGRVVECMRDVQNDGRVDEKQNGEFEHWLHKMGQTRPNAIRSIIILDIFSVSTSCGFGVPRVRRELYANDSGASKDISEADLPISDGVTVEHFAKELSVFEERPTLADRGAWREKKNQVLSYHIEKNMRSLDGLPGLRQARRVAGRTLWLDDVQTRFKKILAEPEAVLCGFALAILLYLAMLYLSTRQWPVWTRLSLLQGKIGTVAQPL
jgi:hypothetical protein